MCAMNEIRKSIGMVPEDSSDITQEHVIPVLEAIRGAINAAAEFIVPVRHTDSGAVPQLLQLENGSYAAAAFTSQEEAGKGATSDTAVIDAAVYLEFAALDADLCGIIIDPWGKSFFLTKNNIHSVFAVDVLAEGCAYSQKNLDTIASAPDIDCGGAELEKAIIYAAGCHSGAVRKGTDVPYILHPMEAMLILRSLNADASLMIAGLLHDVIDDTDTALEDIAARFGRDVAVLVEGHSEDKSQSWYWRKLRTVAELPDSDIRHKLLVLADKLANLRSMYADYRTLGEALWERFNAPKEQQAWYFSGICDGLATLAERDEYAAAYWELNTLYKELFVTHLLDVERGALYQLSACGEGYIMTHSDPVWEPYYGAVPENARRISRQEAESLSDVWIERQ